MAFRAVPEHPKFASFRRLLKVQRYAALGLLESLWHFTAKFCPSGNLGRFSDEDIEAALDWEGAPGAVISALIAARWVDKDPDSSIRLVVHDWSEYSDDATDIGLARHGMRYANGAIPRMRRLSKEERSRRLQQYQETAQGERTECAAVDTSAHTSDISAHAVDTCAHNSALPDTSYQIPVTSYQIPEPKEILSSAGSDDRPSVSEEKVEGKKSAEGVERGVVTEVFEVYRLKARKTSNYQLTSARMQKGLSRFRDCLRLTSGDVEQAKALMISAVEGLCSNPFNRGENDQNRTYLDWIDHLCKSEEMLTKRIDSAPGPQVEFRRVSWDSEEYREYVAGRAAEMDSVAMGAVVADHV